MINELNNFCRVLKIPNELSSEFCFAETKPKVELTMIDWFNPLLKDKNGKLESWERAKPKLKKFVESKKYCVEGSRYLILTDFGESIVIDKRICACGSKNIVGSYNITQCEKCCFQKNNQ